MDIPYLVAVAVVGDGEFETGPLVPSWHAVVVLLAAPPIFARRGIGSH